MANHGSLHLPVFVDLCNTCYFTISFSLLLFSELIELILLHLKVSSQGYQWVIKHYEAPSWPAISTEQFYFYFIIVIAFWLYLLLSHFTLCYLFSQTFTQIFRVCFTEFTSSICYGLLEPNWSWLSSVFIWDCFISIAILYALFLLVSTFLI